MFVQKRLTTYIQTPAEGEISFFAGKQISRPLLNIGKNIDFGLYKNLRSTIKFGYGGSEQDPENLFLFINKGEKQDIPGSEIYIQTQLKDFELPSIRALFENYKDKAALYIQDTGQEKTKKILNKYILEKEIIGMGNSHNLTFKLKNKDRLECPVES